MDLDVLADVRSAAYRRWLAVLVGVAAVAAALFATVESDTGRREEQAFVRSSRSSLRIFASFAASNPRRQFMINGIRQGLKTEIGATARLLASGERSPEAFRAATAVSQAESRAARRYTEAVRASSRISAEAPLDPTTKALVTSSIPHIREILRYQNQQVDVADRYGSRQERAMFAIALVAISAVLLGLAGLMGGGRAGRTSLVAAAMALVVGLLVGGSTFFV
ncbi:MAG TPA: hypothetical protein VHH92_03280 [Actinomycetota bacterium]|nr:hypothetical protein [Actinomycetota bacterium]